MLSLERGCGGGGVLKQWGEISLYITLYCSIWRHFPSALTNSISAAPDKQL